MNNTEAIEFGKEQLEIFGKDSDMYAFIECATKALELTEIKRLEQEAYNRGFRDGAL